MPATPIGLHFLLKLSKRFPIGRFHNEEYARSVVAHLTIQYSNARAQTFDDCLRGGYFVKELWSPAWLNFPREYMKYRHRSILLNARESGCGRPSRVSTT